MRLFYASQYGRVVIVTILFAKEIENIQNLLR